MSLAPFVLLAAYLIGSIPSGFLLVKLARGMDVRQHGSHNVGSINVIRVGGPWLGMATLAADVGKGTLVVALADLVLTAPWLVACAAMLALLGHAFSFWFFLFEQRFSEGKCVATGLGVLIGMACASVVPWWVPVTPLAVWLAGLLLPRVVTGRWYRVSPVTMTAAGVVPLAVWASRPETAYAWLSVGMAALILARHKGNIERLLNGTEPRIGESLVAVSAEQADGSA